MATFHIHNFGCRASQADGASLKQQLLQAGLQEASNPESSSVAILNTCTITASADAEVRQIVRRIHRRNPDCKILVTGCYAQRAPDEIARMEGVTWVVGNSHKHLVGGLVGEEKSESKLSNLPSTSASSPDSDLVQISNPTRNSNLSAATVLVGEIADEFHFAPVFADDRTRPTLKIQDGCDARCSFCIIPTVRGASRSLPPAKVVEQVRQLVDSGYQEIVLSGINLGGYGRDLDRSINFLRIVERVLAETLIARLRISSIELMDVSPELIRLVASEPRMAKHFHIPLQSGCDRILRRMNRRYWTRHYAGRIHDIHAQIPNGAIGADVMVGFPGETDADHTESLRFIESLPFTYLHIFPYSARPRTPAADSPSQVNGRIAKERSQEIRAVIDAKRENFLAAQIGQTLPALTLDEVDDTGGRVALTTNYLKVSLPGSDVRPNQLIEVSVGRVVQGQLFGYAGTAAPALVDVASVLH